IERSNFGTNFTYTICEYSKLSLKFKLQPVPEFIKEVKDAIESKDPRNFKKITEEYGQLISTEVTLGGRVYFKSSNISRERFEENSNKRDGWISDIRIEGTSDNLSRNINNTKHECFKLVGGSQFSINDF